MDDRELRLRCLEMVPGNVGDADTRVAEARRLYGYVSGLGACDGPSQYTEASAKQQPRYVRDTAEPFTDEEVARMTGGSQATVRMTVGGQSGGFSIPLTKPEAA